MLQAVRIKDHWKEQRLFERRVLVAGCLIVVLTLALIGRLYLLQVTRHTYYTGLSQGNRVRTEPIPAARGLMLPCKIDDYAAHHARGVGHEVPAVFYKDS